MKSALQFTAAGLVAMLLASCGTTGSSSSGTGPFDSRGNYVEAWADNPSKWKKGGSSSQPGESLALADDVPADSVPIPSASNTRQPADIGPVAIAAPRPPQRTTVSSNKPPVSKSTSAATKPNAGKTTTASKAKPKPPVASAKPKPKKPVTTRYTIKKGDTLSGIASRNGTTVGALQRANSISGSVIRPGQSLVIPK